MSALENKSQNLAVVGRTIPLKTIVPYTALLALPPDVVAPLRQLLETAPSTCPTRSVEEDVLTGICLALAANADACTSGISRRDMDN